MRWGRSRRYSSANLPALRAGDGGIFPSADGGFSRAAPCRTFTRRRVRRTVGGRSPRNPTMAACSETGSIACVRRWKPLAAGWASPAARIWRIFQCHRSPRSALCCPPPAAPRLAAATRRTGQHLVNGNALVARLLRSALDAGVRFQLNAPVVRLLQGPPGVSARAAQRQREIHVEAGAVVLACGGFPTIASGWRRWCPTRRRVTAISPPHRRTIRARDQAWRIRRRPVRHFPAPPAGRAPVSRVTLASGQQLMFPHLVERAKPGVIAVLPNGKRFVNEADSYHDFIAALLATRATRRRRCWPIVVRCVATAATPDRSRSPPPRLRTGYLQRGNTGGAGEAVRYRRQCAGGNR